MINAVGPTGIPRAIELRGESVGKSEPVAKVDSTASEASSAITTPAAELAAQGARGQRQGCRNPGRDRQRHL